MPAKGELLSQPQPLLSQPETGTLPEIAIHFFRWRRGLYSWRKNCVLNKPQKRVPSFFAGLKQPSVRVPVPKCGNASERPPQLG